MHKDFRQQQRENKTDWWLVGLVLVGFIILNLIFWPAFDQALAR